MRFPKELDKVVDKYLKVWYLVLNKECFDGKLPKDLPITSERHKDRRGACWIKGRTVKGIFIEPRDPEPIRVLLHEMVHAYQTHVMGYPEEYPDHDHAFWQILKVASRQIFQD